MAAKPDELTLFSDLQALIWYATDLAKSSPESLLEPVDVATIPEGGEWRYAVAGALPPPSRALGRRVQGTRGAVSDGVVTIEAKGKGKKKERLEASDVRRYGALLQAVPLVPADAQGQVVALLPAEDVGELLDAASVSGKRLSAVAVAEADEGRAFVQLENAPWYLIERGALPSAKFLRKVPRKRVYVELGFRHPFEALLAEPEDASSALVVARSGHEVVSHGPWEGAGPGGKRWHEVEVSPEEGERSREAGHIEDDLRLVPSRGHADPVVWLADGPEAERAVVRALSRLREDDLTHVDVADLDGPEGRIFVVRELGSDRRGSRAIPRGRGAFVHVPGSRGVYVPSGMRLAPEMPAYVYERAFDMKTGEIALIEAIGDDLVVSKVPESSFRPALGALSFEAPRPVRAGPGGRGSPWISDPWEEDAPSEPQKPPRQARPKGDGPEDEDEGEGRTTAGTDDIHHMSFEEALSSLASAFAASKEDVPKEERDALDKAFKSFTATQQAAIQAAVKAALSGSKPKRNASARDEARVRRLIVKALLESGTIKPAEGGKVAKARKGKKDKTAADKAPAQDPFAELERKLLDFPGDAEGWLRLAREYLAAGEREEAVRAAEMAAWEGDGEVAKRAWEIMADADVTGGYAAVVKFAADAPSLAPMRFVEAANAAADASAAASERRKRARWLLNSAIAAVADDGLHAGRERDAILAELATRGVATSELPGLVRRRLLERYSAAEATGEAAEAASSLLGGMVEIAASIKSPIGAAEVLGEAAIHLASMGEAEKASKVAREAIGRLSQAAPEEDEGGRRRPRRREALEAGGGLRLPPGEDRGWAISALSKAGAALVIAQEHTEGFEALSTAVRWIEEGWEAFSTWEAVQHMFGAMAKAGLRRGDQPVDRVVELLHGAFEEDEDRPLKLKHIGRLIEDLGDELHVEIETVQALGITDDLADVAKRMIHEPGLSHYEYEGTASAIAKLGGRLGPDEAEVLLRFAESGYDDVGGYNSFTGEFLLVPALSAIEDPLGRARELVRSEAISDNAYQVLMIGLSSVRAAIDVGTKPDEVQEALEALVAPALAELKAADPHAYEEAGSGGGSRKNFFFLVRQLVEAVPAAYADDRRRGAKIIQRLFDEGTEILSGSDKNAVSFSAGLIAACVRAMAALGFTGEAAQMAEPLLEMVEKSESGHNLNEVAQHATEAAQEVDDRRLLTRLSKAVKKASEPMLDPRRSRDAARAISAMTEAVKASAKANDEASAEAMALAAAKALSELKGDDMFGAFDAATSLAEAASALSGASRYDVASEIASAIKVFASKSIGPVSAIDGARATVTAGRKFLVEGSAYKEALAKWKGEDERRIRDRIVADCRPE